MSDDNFHYAQAVHAAAYAAERRAEALSSARTEVSRRRAEVEDRRLQLDALVDSDALQRSRLETGLVVAIERLSWAEGALARILNES